jgi:uncharacterized protein DUF1612/DNA binding protein with HTH domain
MTEANLVLASVTLILVKVIKLLRDPYHIPDPLPWREIAGPLAAAEDAVARLDERLAKSPIREGWVARTHITDACASLWLDGELVHLEDLVLHDAGMDVRAPTHELTRAHAVLRTRRRIASAEPDWALTPTGLDNLRGRSGEGAPTRDAESNKTMAYTDGPREDVTLISTPLHDEHDALFANAIAAVDAAMKRTERALAGESVSRSERNPLVYDLDWDETAELADWRRSVDATKNLPPILAGALATMAWDAIAPLQHMPWLGRLLTAALLRARNKTRAHLVCVNDGLRALPHERRWTSGQTTKLTVAIDAFAAAADAGLKNHDRWLMARRQLERKLTGRRSTSKLPALIDLILATPIASAGMIAGALQITPRAAQDMVTELGLRETTGRGRYRAWGIL